ncbi:hypothetical protein MTO96_007392 [Rhipicephalus appendiculatus]
MPKTSRKCKYARPWRNELVVRVLRYTGGQTFEVEEPSGNTYFARLSLITPAELPRQGDFVVVERMQKACWIRTVIRNTLYPKDIKYMKEQGLWPTAFEYENYSSEESESEDSEASFSEGDSSSDDNDSISDDSDLPDYESDSTLGDSGVTSAGSDDSSEES